jgi:hypothetical protein
VIQLKTNMSGSRSSSARRADWLPDELPPHAGPAGSQSLGGAAAVQWLAQRKLSATSVLRWHVEIALDVVEAPAPKDFDALTATRFHIDIYSEEWGVFFCHAGRSSWVRITDIAFVHGRDDFGLLATMPPLKDVGALLRRLEHQHGVQLQRGFAAVRTNLANAEPAIRRWIASL